LETLTVPKQWTVDWVAVEALFANPANPRRNDAAVPHVAASIRRFGWQQPIVAKRSGEVIAGHTRLKAALELGEKLVPVVRFDGTDLDAIAFGIADNKSHEFSEWDDDALAKLLGQLREEDALDAVGFSTDEVDALIAELDAKLGAGGQLEDQGPETPPEQPTSRPGDLWLLGHHRLLCGDSTKPEDIARVLAGEKVALLATDPPYCVEYTGNDRPIHDGKPSGKDWTHVYREIDIADLGQFLDGVFASCLPHLVPHAPLYVWHAHVQQPTVAAAFGRHGLLLHQVIVWVKPTAVFGHSYFRWRHEPCAFGWVQGNKPEHGTAQLDTVWECDWEGKQRVVGNEHPTQKPTRLFEIPMELHTRAGSAVLEPFSGSGSQLIAAEKLGRRCRAVEISPAFVDVAIRRWQKATGRQATLEATGEAYDALVEKRGGA
jgi:DNA modification methylase